MNPENPLQQLRAAHMPTDIGWWPPALGWWLLLAIVIALMVLLVVRWQRQRKASAYRRQAQHNFQHLVQQYQQQQDPHLLLNSIGELLRRTCISQFGRQRIAALSGDEWLEFLDQTGATLEFSRGIGRVLVTERYAKNPNIDAQRLISLTKRWLDSQR